MGTLSNLKQQKMRTLNQIAKEYASELYDACLADDLNGYFDNVLDYRIVIDKYGCYQGCQLLMAYGGPTVWINTDFNEIRVIWGGCEGHCALLSDRAQILNLYLKDFFEATKEIMLNK